MAARAAYEAADLLGLTDRKGIARDTVLFLIATAIAAAFGKYGRDYADSAIFGVSVTLAGTFLLISLAFAWKMVSVPAALHHETERQKRLAESERDSAREALKPAAENARLSEFRKSIMRQVGVLRANAEGVTHYTQNQCEAWLESVYGFVRQECGEKGIENLKALLVASKCIPIARTTRPQYQAMLLRSLASCVEEYVKSVDAADLIEPEGAS